MPPAFKKKVTQTKKPQPADPSRETEKVPDASDPQLLCSLAWQSLEQTPQVSARTGIYRIGCEKRRKGKSKPLFTVQTPQGRFHLKRDFSKQLNNKRAPVVTRRLSPASHPGESMFWFSRNLLSSYLPAFTSSFTNAPKSFPELFLP